jgi:hypothetical protein
LARDRLYMSHKIKRSLRKKLNSIAHKARSYGLDNFLTLAPLGDPEKELFLMEKLSVYWGIDRSIASSYLCKTAWFYPQSPQDWAKLFIMIDDPTVR